VQAEATPIKPRADLDDTFIHPSRRALIQMPDYEEEKDQDDGDEDEDQDDDISAEALCSPQVKMEEVGRELSVPDEKVSAAVQFSLCGLLIPSSTPSHHLMTVMEAAMILEEVEQSRLADTNASSICRTPSGASPRKTLHRDGIRRSPCPSLL